MEEFKGSVQCGMKNSVDWDQTIPAEIVSSLALFSQLCRKLRILWYNFIKNQPGRVAQSVGHLTRKSGVLGSIPGLATYFRFSLRFFKKGSCELLAKVCARSTG